jgi:hypothetical protein
MKARTSWQCVSACKTVVRRSPEPYAPSHVPADPTEFRNDGAPSVGKLLGTLADSSLTSSVSVFDFPVASISLAPSTRYWIQVSKSNPTTSASWSHESNASGVGVANEYFANTQGSSEWNVYPNNLGPYQMLLSGTVPEPCSLIALSSLGAMGLLGCAWRLRMARKSGGRPFATSPF